MPPAKPIHWTPIVIAAIAAGTVISVTDILQHRQPVSRPAAVSEVKVKSEVTSEIRSTSESRPDPVPVPTPAAAVPPSAPEPLVLRAQPVEPVVRRAMPVEGQYYAVPVPDGRTVLVRYMGTVPTFDQLPKDPALYDLYRVAASGHAWVFMQPAGFSAPAWVDP